MSSPHQLRRALAEYARALHARGWVANHDGNASVRLDQEDRFLISPTAVSKRLVAQEGIVLCDRQGRPVGRGKPPSEVALHVGAFRARPDARAVIHAHPPFASAFALLCVPMEPIAMPEVVVSLGDHIPLVPVLLPKDPGAADAVGKVLQTSDVALLGGNGVIAIGHDLEQAYLRLELVEHYATILHHARAWPRA